MSGSGKMVQWAEILVSRPDDWSSTPGFTNERRELALKNCPLNHTFLLWHVSIHIHTPYISNVF